MGDNLALIRQYPALVASSQAIDKNSLAPGVLVGNLLILNYQFEVTVAHVSGKELGLGR
jgi:hypothetical protein